MSSEMDSKKPRPEFDPFKDLPDYSSGSRSWFWATALQAGVTCCLLGIAYLARGHAWEKHAGVIVMLGIIATWSLALRTIRERLVELMKHWRKYSMGLMRKASESGLHMIAVPISKAQEAYIKGSIWRLRIIAAGLTIPFFVMPMMWSVIAVVFSFKLGPYARDYWTAAAVFTMASALIVAGYFHWSIVPAPVPLRIGANKRSAFPSRKRGRWAKGR